MLTLAYHNVLSGDARGVPTAGNQVRIDTLREHLRRLRSRLLHPADVHQQLLRGKAPRGVMITFDDGAAGLIDAAKVLAEAGAVGVAFICPGALKAGLWFYELANILLRTRVGLLAWRGLRLPASTLNDRERAYDALSPILFDSPARHREKALAEIRAQARVDGAESHPALSTLDEEGARLVAETGAIIFANHSWSHPNLVSLNGRDLSYEVEAAQSWLASSGLPFLPWFAFPRGAHDARVRKEVSRHCRFAFGASMNEQTAEVLPRALVYDLDANPMRFRLKTVLEGRLRRTMFWR
jgi:peptidoglycan/xylan/chitin deacetylase (PgdA/CDA1 family)